MQPPTLIGSSAFSHTGSRRLKRFAFGHLALHQKRLGEPALPADLERSKVLVPRPIRRLRFRFPPKLQLVEVFDGNLTFLQAVKKVLAEGKWKIRPLNLGHQSPKVMRASSSLIPCRSMGSSDSAIRLASAKNRRFSASLAWMPASIKSITTRLALVFRVLAIACTCFAMRCGRDML